MKNRSGITLISLVITVIVLSILASIATYSGVEVIKSAKMTAFTTELKIMQTQINTLYQEDPNKIYGQAIDSNEEIKKQAEQIFKIEEAGIASYEGYTYWSADYIKNELKIEGIEQSFFVNLSQRSIVSFEGLKYDGEKYYTLSQLPNGLYNVDYQEEKDTKPAFEIKVETLGINKWRLSILNIQYEGYINKWQVAYRLENRDYWNTTEDLSFVVNTAGRYQIQLINGEIKSEEKEQIVVNDYAKEGLKLYYDGIQNTRNGNNPEATTWEDLSGNRNDGILTNMMNIASGYYSLEEKGYVFLQDNSYIRSTNKIGITGDANYTIEIVLNLWEEGSASTTSNSDLSQPIGWGATDNIVGTSGVFGYHKRTKKIGYDFANNSVYTNDAYNIVGKTSYMSFRKTKVGQIENGNTDIGKINCNGQDILNTYTGEASFIPSLEDTEVQIGGNIGRTENQTGTFCGSIQAVRIYNRVLTEDEVQRNYQTDRIRFNIE